MKHSLGSTLFQACLITFMIILCIVMLYPFVHMLSISFSTPAEALRLGIHLYPQKVSLFAWEKVLGNPDIWTGFGNTLFSYRSWHHLFHPVHVIWCLPALP